MRISFLSFNLYFATFFSIAAVSVSGRCQSDQREFLLGLKNSLNSSLSVKLATWNESTDCCSWDGITCDTSGRVTELDLSNQSISGAIDGSNSLFRLRHLQQLNLAYNTFTSEFSSDLSFNEHLEGSFQKFPQNASLQSLVVSGTNFGGQLPESIGNLGELTRIEMWNCKFKGAIPNTLENLTQLTYLIFFNNSFSGPVPSFTSLRNLIVLELGYNQLNGSILSTNWYSLRNLKFLSLRENSFSGNVPPTLFRSKSLKVMDLSQNQFSDGFNEVKGEYSSLLELIDLSDNRLQGPFPMFLFEIQGLERLSLSRNKFSGLILLSVFQKLQNLRILDLSYNNLSIETSYTNPLLPPLLPTIYELKLASCNLTKFPDFLKNLSSLGILDLSNNRIHGKIPSWIWEKKLVHLNLSLNFLVELETPLNISPYLNIVDLHGNQLQWKIPFFPSFAYSLDYSNNNLTSVLPPELGDFISKAYFFSLSGNKIYGSIPESICNGILFQVLDMSNNSLSGPIPQCLIQMSAYIGVLNLKRNHLSGEIPDAFPVNCTLQTLDLNRNRLGGKIPKSLANCRKLEVLDLGRNQIDDTFPCHLKSISSLRVLVLRSNKFKGDINCRGNNVTWPMLQIIDLASNSFSGKLPQGLMMTWNAMKVEKYETYPEQLRFSIMREIYFQDSMTVIMKGLELELVKILTIFTSIDFSSNKFEGEVPEAIGDLKALYLLNLSNNALAGTIPSFLGDLSKLEALDLSRNRLTGQIPVQLASLNFLSFLNLSDNKLMGKIPSGRQLQTFLEASYENNRGLCGFPLKVQCESPPATKDGPSISGTGNHIDWNLIRVEIGFVFGFGAAILPLMFWKRWRVWYYKRTDRVLYKFFPKLDRNNRYRGTIARWPQRRRQ